MFIIIINRETGEDKIDILGDYIHDCDLPGVMGAGPSEQQPSLGERVAPSTFCPVCVVGIPRSVPGRRAAPGISSVVRPSRIAPASLRAPPVCVAP